MENIICGLLIMIGLMYLGRCIEDGLTNAFPTDLNISGEVRKWKSKK